MTRIPRPLQPRGLVLQAALAALLCGTAFAEPRTLVIARDMDINSLDPHHAWCDTCQIFNSAAYESLVTLDKDNKLQPLLAKSWEVNPEQTQITLHLDPAAKFADGSPVEAKDVKWSYERLENLKTNTTFMVDPIAAIETPDAATVVLKLAAPNSEYLQILASSYMAVLNSDLVAENGGLADATAVDKDTAEAWFLTHSAGSAPFVLDSYEPNSELRLKRNDAYWGSAAAKVPEVVFRQIKDAVAQAQALQSGSVDIAQQIDAETAKSLTGDDVVVENLPSLNFVYLALSPGAVSNKVPLDAKVREAISVAIDRKSLIDFVVGGAGNEIAVPVAPGFPGADGHKVPQYDPERAKALLAEAGHPDGFEIEAIYPDMNVYGVDFGLMMQKVQQDLSKVGIKVKIGHADYRTDIQRVREVRKALGDEVWIAVDANQKWDFPTAVRVGRELEQLGIAWFEEPLLCEDIPGHARLAAALDIPIAMGETLGSRFEFDAYIRAHAADILQPDIVRVGGITEMVKVATMAEVAQLPVAPHHMMESTIQVACGVMSSAPIEYMPWVAGAFAEPAEIKNGCMLPPQKPGLGLEIPEETIRRFRVE